jgi:hypothetical protein
VDIFQRRRTAARAFSWHIRDMPRSLGALVLLGWCLLAPSSGNASQRLDLLAEVKPARATFFSGDVIEITALGAAGTSIFPNLIEILQDDKVVFEYPLIVAAFGRVERDGRPFHTATLVLSVDHLLPPGVYRARARSGVAVSSFTEPFTVAAWGTPTGGVQVALSAAPVLKREDGLLVRITLRNAHNRALLVPSGISPPGCATPWFEFVFFDSADAAVGRGFRDDRKDCQQQPRVLLRPGETTTADVDLGQLNEHGHAPRTPFRPAPGRYRLHVTVRGRTTAPTVDVGISGTTRRCPIPSRLKSSNEFGQLGFSGSLEPHLKSPVAVGLVAICIVMGTWIGLVVWGRLAGPTVDATDIVTVVEYVDGNVGRHERRFRHLVRTSGGAEYRMTFGELYPVGSRLSVSYRRFARGDAIKVMFYSRVPD